MFDVLGRYTRRHRADRGALWPNRHISPAIWNGWPDWPVRAAVRAVWLTMPTSARSAEFVAAGMDLHKRLRDGGADFWTTFAPKPISIFLNFDHSLFFEWMPAWHDMMYSPKDQREAILPTRNGGRRRATTWTIIAAPPAIRSSGRM